MLAAAPAFATEPPAAFGVAGHAAILTLHGEGVQLYECKPDAKGHAAWTFREPVATLINGDETVGRHFAGPRWELEDGSLIQGKVTMSEPGASPDDVPLLKLSVARNNGAGALKDATIVLRLNTHGGALKGECVILGALRALPYSADYAFLR